MHIPEETAERANNIDCERANPACICLWGESLFTHTKQKINSNIPGLIILKQIQPRTYGLEGFCICGLFSHHSFYLTLVENMIEQSGLFLAGQWFASSALCFFACAILQWSFGITPEKRRTHPATISPLCQLHLMIYLPFVLLPKARAQN